MIKTYFWYRSKNNEHKLTQNVQNLQPLIQVCLQYVMMSGINLKVRKKYPAVRSSTDDQNGVSKFQENVI